MQLIKFFLERDTPILVDLIDEVWEPVISVLRHFATSLGPLVLSVRVFREFSEHRASPDCCAGGH